MQSVNAAELADAVTNLATLARFLATSAVVRATASAICVHLYARRSVAFSISSKEPDA